MRANGESFEALSDRLSFQIRVFERSPDDTAALFVGTSRFADAIDQSIFARGVENRTGQPVRAFNGAMAGINLEEILSFAEVVCASETLPRVIVEASGPALTEGPGEKTVEEEKDPALQGIGEKRFPDRFENRLQGWFAEHSSLVRYRKAFRPRTFLRLGVLYTANFVDPGKWSRKGVIRGLLTSAEFEIPAAEFNALQPLRFGPGVEERFAGQVDGNEILGDPVYRGMRRVAEALEKGSAEVIWVTPPLSEYLHEIEGSTRRRAIYERIAEEFGVRILDYSTLELDESLFRDRSHLNKKGRTLFSRLVARDLSESW